MGAIDSFFSKIDDEYIPMWQWVYDIATIYNSDIKATIEFLKRVELKVYKKKSIGNYQEVYNTNLSYTSETYYEGCLHSLTSYINNFTGELNIESLKNRDYSIEDFISKHELKNKQISLNMLKVYNIDICPYDVEKSNTMNSNTKQIEIDQFMDFIDDLLKEDEQSSLTKPQITTVNTTPAKDELAPRTQKAITKLLYALLVEHGYELGAKKGNTNDILQSLTQKHGVELSREFIATQLDKVNKLEKT